MNTPARFRFAILATWLLACAIMLWIMRDNIAAMSMLDADDYLRLQQVRDWIGGQGFTDVAQYRINPPEGVPMHWSRIVDLPLAGLILLLRPLLGAAFAEQVTVTAVPLLTLGGSLIAIALIGTRLADRRAALIAVMLAATTPLLLFHVMPLRIDHHGWQTMAGLFTVGACFDRRARRGGLVAGAFAALWLAISLEALPMVVAIGGLLALRFIIDGERYDSAGRFHGFAAALAMTGLLLFAGFHGPAAWFRNYCDAVSPAWFGPMVATPALIALILPVAARRGAAARIALMIAAGGIGAALLAITAPACLNGPFAALDPVVRQYWYKNVVEGLPVWDQPTDNALFLIGFPLVGIVGGLIGWRRAGTAEGARNWLTMLGILLAAFAVSLLVQRAGGFAHGCALPGAGLLVASLLDRIARWRRAGPRTLASAFTILALSPVGAVVVGNIVLPESTEKGETRTPEQHLAAICLAPCTRFTALALLPPATILTGIDLTPRLLTITRHRYVGSGHHRAPQAIRRVIDSFIGPPEVARRIMAERGVSYLLIDPSGNEERLYSKQAPYGLMARLRRGEVPDWLQPVPLHGSSLKLWRRVG